MNLWVQQYLWPVGFSTMDSGRGGGLVGVVVGHSHTANAAANSALVMPPSLLIALASVIASTNGLKLV